MNTKTVFIIALLAFFIGGLGWWMNRTSPPAQDFDQEMLLPTLSTEIAAITEVRLSDAAGKKVTFAEKDGSWRISEKGHYFADMGKFRALINVVGKAHVIEQKTANPDYYERLGVRDTANPESKAIQLEIDTAGSTTTILIGEASTRAGGSTHVRRADDAVTLLVSPAISVSTEILSWVNKDVIDIGLDEVQSVRIQRADGVTQILKSALHDEEFVLNDSEQPGQASTMATLARGLEDLKFENVQRSITFAINAYKYFDVTYTLFDGTIIDGKIFYSEKGEDEENQYWFSASARFDEQVAHKFVPQPTQVSSENQESGEAPEIAQEFRLTSTDLQDRRIKTQELTGKLNGWIYRIPEYRFNNFNYTKESLTQN